MLTYVSAHLLSSRLPCGQVSLERVAAFFKRLLSISLHTEHHHSVSALALMRDLLHKYPRLVPMLENDVIATGIHLPLLGTPEHTNALAATVWEMGYHRRHYHPWDRMHALHVLAGAPMCVVGEMAEGQEKGEESGEEAG